MQLEAISGPTPLFHAAGVQATLPEPASMEEAVSDTAVTQACLFGRVAMDRRAYRHLLEDEFNLEVVLESDFESTSVWAAVTSKPGLAILCDDTPSGAGTDTLRAVQLITELVPQTKIVVIGSTPNRRFVELWTEQKIMGYLIREDNVCGLRTALEAVVANRRYLSESAQSALEGTPAAPKHLPLSRRERELLELLANGRKLREAAAAMSVSYKTADAHRTRLMQKLGIHDRVELVRYAIREKIIEA